MHLPFYLPCVVLIKIEGIKANESVLHRIRCTYEGAMGDLVLTNKGIVFLEIKGMLGERRERLHQFNFDEIRDIQTKKKKSGIYTHGIVLNQQSDSLENHSYYYSCEEYKAVLFLAFFERQILLQTAPKEISSTIQSLSTIKRNADLLKVAKTPKMRPYFFAFCLDRIESEILGSLKDRFDINLFELAKSKQIHSLVALLHESDPRRMAKDQVYYTVVDFAGHLIFRGELDGKVTELGRYISSKALARINAPIDTIADFETIFSQLHEKGLLIWAIECPNCFRKIKYPKKGKETTCQSCKTTIHARDVLKKFVDLL